MPSPRYCPVTSGTVAMMIGFSTTMYAIVKNVARPPRISAANDDSRAVMWK